MNLGKAYEKQLGLFRCVLALTAVLLISAPSLLADSTATKTVTLFFKSYERDVADQKFIFYVTSSELPAETGDWHPGIFEKGYKIKDMIGSFKIIKFVPLKSKGSGDSFDETDKSVLLLENDAKPPVKVVLPIGEKISVQVK